MSAWFKENCQSCAHINEPDIYEDLKRELERGKAGG